MFAKSLYSTPPTVGVKIINISVISNERQYTVCLIMQTPPEQDLAPNQIDLAELYCAMLRKFVALRAAFF